MTHDEVAARIPELSVYERLTSELVASRRIVSVRIGGRDFFAAVEDASRLRDAFGVVLPLGLPLAHLESVADPLGDMTLRYARRHGPFTARELAARYGLGPAPIEAVLLRLKSQDKVQSGEFFAQR